MLGGCFFFLLAFVFVSYNKRQSKWMLSLLYRLLVAHFYWCTGSIDCIRRYVCTPLYNIMRTLIFWPTSVYSDAMKQNGKKEFGHPKEKIKNEEKKNQEQATMEQHIDFAENRLIGVMLFRWIPKWQCRKLLYATKATILLQESREWCARDHRCKQHGHGHQLPVLCRSMCGRTRVAHACTYALSICC